MERRHTKVATAALAQQDGTAIIVRSERYKEPKLLMAAWKRQSIDRQHQLARAYDIMQIRSFWGSGEPVWLSAL